jgi:hypothetical protein
MVFSDNIQQNDFLHRVVISAGDRSGILLTNGYGGAEGIGIDQVECGFAGPTNPCMNIQLTASGTLVRILKSQTESGGTTASGISITGGFIDVESFHCEGVSQCIFSNFASVNNGAFYGVNLTGAGTVTNVVVRQGGSSSGNYLVGMVIGGASCPINNGGACIPSSGNIQYNWVNF